MSIQALTDRIRADAEAEADEIIRAARERAAEEVKQAETQAARAREKEEAAVAERIRAMDEGSAATVRLEGKKIALAARRRVIGKDCGEKEAEALARAREDRRRFYSARKNFRPRYFVCGASGTRQGRVPIGACEKAL